MITLKEKTSIKYSQAHAKILRLAWSKGNVVTSEDVSSVLYYEGKRIPRSDRSKAIRNAVMTLRRMIDEGLIVDVVKDERTRLRKYVVVSKEELRLRIIRELNELFGKDFI
jgi:hypothetical protein